MDDPEPRSWESWIESIRNEDEVDIAEPTLIEWKRWLLEARSELVDELMSEYFSCHICHLLSLATSAGLRQMISFAGAGFVNVSAIEVCLDLDGLVESIESLALAGGETVTQEQLIRAGASLGSLLGHFKKIESIHLLQCDSFTMPIISAILKPCRNLRQLSFCLTPPENLQEDDQEEVIIFEEAFLVFLEILEYHPTLKFASIGLLHFQPRTFRQVCNSLSTIPQLDNVHLWGDPVMHLASIEDINAIQRLLSNTKMRKIDLSHLLFENEELALLFCQSIAASQVTNLRVLDWTFPASLDAAVATMLACSSITDLTYESRVGPNFLKALNLALRCLSSKLESLSITDPRLDQQTDDMLLLLQHTEEWRIATLSLDIPEWTDAFEDALAECVRSASYLRKLSVTLMRSADQRLPVTPHLLLNAIKKGVRMLESVLITGRFGNRDAMDMIWYDRLNHAIETNHKRRDIEHLYGKPVVDAAQLATALQDISLSTLFEFLVYNEFNWQVSLLKHGRQRQRSQNSVNKERTNRKRAAQEISQDH
jgi:hypothetical protein